MRSAEPPAFLALPYPHAEAETRGLTADKQRRSRSSDEPRSDAVSSVPVVPFVQTVPFVPPLAGCPTGTALGTVPWDSAKRWSARAKTPLTGRSH
jgi:hypothetical protein